MDLSSCNQNLSRNAAQFVAGGCNPIRLIASKALVAGPLFDMTFD